MSRDGHRLSRLRHGHREDNGTIGEILKQNGYATSWFGKNHNTPGFDASQAGPFDQWPIGMGFEYFYGFVGGDTSQWQPNLFRNTTPIDPFQGKPGWNLITAMADDAIEHMKRLNEIAPDKPFFVYYVPGGTHAPHHPTPEWIEKIRDSMFDNGWNELRETIFANQKRLGVIPANAKLTAWPEELPKWDTLAWTRRRCSARQAEVYAAYLAYTDHEIGRVIQAVEDMGKLDNTLDHLHQRRQRRQRRGHATARRTRLTSLQRRRAAGQGADEVLRRLGLRQDLPAHGGGWAWAFDTPFQWTKQVASHFGGTRQGMAISWPARIKDAGGIRTQFHHVIDIVPTILEAAGIAAPDTVDGIPQKPDRRREHGLHLGQGQRRRAVDAQDAVLRDARQPRASTTTAGWPRPRRRRRRGS